MKKLVKLGLVLVLSFSLFACASNNQSTTQGVKDGVYEATAKGNNGPVKVAVTLKNEAIEKVEVLEHTETAGLSDNAIKNIPVAIVENQSISVDTVSGATVSSNAIIAAVTAALESAGVDIAKFKKEVSKTELKIEDLSTEVIIIGSGGAGLSAAIEAREAGAEVVVIEKMPFAGGNTLLSYAELACANNWLQEEKGIKDSKEQFAKEMWEGGGKVARKEMVDTVVDGALDGALWLRDTIGVKYQDYLVHEGGHTVARAVEPIELGPGMINPMVDYANKIGVKILYNVKAEELIVENGKVVGVSVSSGDSTAKFTASKGVVLATGGFGANVDMRVKYNKRWKTLDESVKTTNSPGATGEGILMAEKIGAQLEGMEYIQLYPFNNPITGVFYGIEAPSWSGEGIVYVNMDGKRFVNETGMRDERAEGILAQNGKVFAIYNQEVADRLNMEEKFAGEYEQCLKDGVFFKADTLEEIAKHFGINEKNLVETMKKYNEYMEAGKDPEFNRKTSMVTMKEGPWFILEGVVSVHHTMGGVMIDEQARVLDASKNPIPGLYAAGEVTGSIHGNNRVGTFAISEIVVFGRIAGKNVANEK